MSAVVALGTLAPGEVDQAVALWQAAGLTRPWNDPVMDCRRALEGPASEVLALREGGALIGTAMVGHDGHRGWVYYVAVAESHRGRGFGAQLIRAAEEWVAQQGVPKMMLMVRSDNVAVAEFYRSLGYEDQQTMVLGRRLFDA